MRLLLLVLNMLVGVSLLTTTDNVLAAYGSIKVSKNHHSKHSGRSIKKKASHNPGDIWERIRSGMKIPRPGPVQELPEQTLITKNSPLLQTTLIPEPTRVVRLHKRTGVPIQLDKVNAMIASATIAKHDATLSENNYPESLSTQKISSPGNAASGQTRFRTLIGVPTELLRLNAKVTLERVNPKPLITRVSPVKAPTTAVSTAKTTASNPGCVKPKGQDLADLVPQPPLIDKQEIADPCRGTQASHYDRVNKQIAWYAQRPAYLSQVAERARPYLYHIVEKLSKNKLPLELALLPIVESAYQPTALSPKSAAGLWQFIPGTGNDFDLEQSDNYDERLDVTASTQAAIRFLSGLKQHFNGDWLLALAAYNCGQGAVDAAISRNAAEGLPTDFWSLPLPEETRDYVPRLLALSSIFANPAQYHLKLPSIRNEPYFVKVKINHHNDIKYLAGKNVTTVARLANLSDEQFSLLNPGFVSPTLPTTASLTFLMPAENADRLHQGLAALTRVTMDMQKKEPAFSTVMSALTAHKLPKFSTPFLSLDMSGDQTAPRRVNHDLFGIL